MLVLSRKPGERVVIGDEITLVVKQIHGDRVAIGVEAPQWVSVLRSELLDKARAPTHGAPPSRVQRSETAA